MDNQTRRRRPQGPRRRPVRRNPQQGNNMLIPHPPPLQDMGLRREVRMRFLCTSAFANDVTYQNLLDIFNVVTVSAVSAIDLFTAVKVKAVEVWANALANASVEAVVIFDGATVGQAGDQKIHQDSSMGIEPAHVRAVPGRMTQAAQFQASTANKAFYLSCPSGAIVDLELSFRNPIAALAVATANPPAGGTAGAVYVRGFDGAAAAASKFTPQGPLAVD